MVEGKARRTGWLGQPLGPPIHLARSAPDLLEGKGVAWAADLIPHFQGPDAAFAIEARQLRVSAGNGAGSLVFRVEDVPCKPAQDLLVTLKLKAQSRAAYPAAMPRLLKCQAEAKDTPGAPARAKLHSARANAHNDPEWSKDSAQCEYWQK